MQQPVLLAGVARPARGDDVLPDVLTAARAGDARGRGSRPAARSTGSGGRRGRTRRGATAARRCGTAPARSGGAGSPTAPAPPTCSAWNSAPLRCTISAFSFSTSTTARRADTTHRGSKLALSISALPNRDLPKRPAQLTGPTLAPPQIRDQVVAAGPCAGAVRGLGPEPQVRPVGTRHERRRGATSPAGSSRRAAGARSPTATASATTRAAPGTNAAHRHRFVGATGPRREGRAIARHGSVYRPVARFRLRRPGGVPWQGLPAKEHRGSGGTERRRDLPRRVRRARRAGRTRPARQAAGGAPRAGLPVRRGPPPDRGRARRRQDVARQGDRPRDRRLVAAHPVHPRPAADRRHRRVDLEPHQQRLRVPARARCSRTSCSPTRSTARRRRRSRRCSSRWRSARSRSTGTPTRCRRRSW